jgi:hypothetical protein
VSECPCVSESVRDSGSARAHACGPVEAARSPGHHVPLPPRKVLAQPPPAAAEMSLPRLTRICVPKARFSFTSRSIGSVLRTQGTLECQSRLGSVSRAPDSRRSLCSMKVARTQEIQAPLNWCGQNLLGPARWARGWCDE